MIVTTDWREKEWRPHREQLGEIAGVLKVAGSGSGDVTDSAP